ncbi:hypothetical protein ACROYT_G014999 [Oculina patagonica]
MSEVYTPANLFDVNIHAASTLGPVASHTSQPTSGITMGNIHLNHFSGNHGEHHVSLAASSQSNARSTSDNLADFGIVNCAETHIEAAAVAINDVETSAYTNEVVEVECRQEEVIIAASKSAKDVSSKKNRKVTQHQVLQEQYKALILKKENLKLERRKLELEVLLLEKKANKDIITTINLGPIVADRQLLSVQYYFLVLYVCNIVMAGRQSSLVQDLLNVLQTYQSGNSPRPTVSASAIARSLQEDSALAQNIGRVLGSSSSPSSASSGSHPLMPFLRQPSLACGLFNLYGRRKKKDQKTYDMKLVIVDFIDKVNDTAQTKRFNGNTDRLSISSAKPRARFSNSC